MSEQTQPPVSPWDSHNQKLVANVHPADWKNPHPAPRYNLVVIGGGTAGLVTAAGAAGLGAKVALIEKHLLGGDCLNVGCVPSKAIIRAARAVALVREAVDFGVQVPPGTTADFGKAMERMRHLRADISPHDSAKRFTELGVDVFLGAAKFTGPDSIEVGGQTLRFAKAVIATGARAAAPPIPGLKDVPYLTNETLFSLTELPKRLGVIGAGPIGCEMAQSFARFGSEVFLVEALHGILPREDRDAADIVQAAIIRDGVKLLCRGKDLKLAKDPNGVRLQVESHGKGYDVLVDQLLVAVGRAPNVEGLGLETVGVEFDKKGVRVNDRLQTTNPRIYACGDICSPYQFTHAADFMARIVIQNALFKGRAKASSLIIPWATYTSPEIAHVGLYKKDAEEKGIAVDNSLKTNPVVFGPATDGGYYLIGLTHPAPELFKGVAWGTETVLAHSIEILARNGNQSSMLNCLDDIDRPEDLPAWQHVASIEDAEVNRVSVIIPALNEGEQITNTIASAQAGRPHEILVVDGGSTDDTIQRAREAGAVVINSAPGRARQMNAGVARATGNSLLFLHADTLLPRDYLSAVSRVLRQPDIAAGAFRFRVAGDLAGKWILEWATNLRSHWRQMPYGDQALFIRRSLFEEIGGFADLPIMEDYELVRRLRKRGRIVITSQAATTSGRRWRRLGLIRTTLINKQMIVGYHLGCPIGKLAEIYKQTRLRSEQVVERHEPTSTKCIRIREDYRGNSNPP